MVRKMLKETVKKLLVDAMVEKLDPAFILLFGSHAKGTARAESDIDLAYFSERELSSYERFILAADLSGLAGREVDLIDIKQIDTVFNMQVFADGKPIYMQDENEFVRQQMRAYSMYVTLNEQRAPIVETIKERGSVFGDE